MRRDPGRRRRRALAATARGPWAWEGRSRHSGAALNEFGVGWAQGAVVVGWRRTFYRPLTEADTPRLVFGGIAYTGPSREGL